MLKGCENMYCSKCGTNNMEGAKFCYKCGAEINRAEEEITTTEVITPIDKATGENAVTDDSVQQEAVLHDQGAAETHKEETDRVKTEHISVADETVHDDRNYHKTACETAFSKRILDDCRIFIDRYIQSNTAFQTAEAYLIGYKPKYIIAWLLFLWHILSASIIGVVIGSLVGGFVYEWVVHQSRGNVDDDLSWFRLIFLFLGISKGFISASKGCINTYSDLQVQTETLGKSIFDIRKLNDFLSLALKDFGFSSWDIEQMTEGKDSTNKHKISFVFQGKTIHTMIFNPQGNVLEINTNATASGALSNIFAKLKETFAAYRRYQLVMPILKSAIYFYARTDDLNKPQPT